MSGYAAGVDDGGQATLDVGAGLSSSLLSILTADDIVPGSSASYQLCKTIFVYHPLGGKMAESPVKLAQCQEREFTIPGAPEDDLLEAFKREWRSIGSIGADLILRNHRTLSRVYGIASLAVGTRGQDPGLPLDLATLHEQDLYFNTLDSLNTAGSLVLNQDPNSPDFLKPSGVSVAGVPWHASRTCVLMNDQPIYIQWSTAGFGFVGRSVYQRALYPLKSYIQTMITDQSVAEKVALLILKMKSPGSIVDQRSRSWFGFKRQALKGAKTGNVLSLGIDEAAESLNFTNLKDAAEYSRSNILKNIATAADMPASLINQETLAEGFGEGTEDAKTIARYIDGERIAMEPAYRFMDAIVMRRAWNPEFYKSVQRKYPEAYGDMPYETAFYGWKNAFKAQWPNLLVEPDSEQVKTDDVVIKGAIAMFEVLADKLDPENLATAAEWLAGTMNARKQMRGPSLELDYEALRNYEPPQMTEGDPETVGQELKQGKDRLRVAT